MTLFVLFALFTKEVVAFCNVEDSQAALNALNRILPTTVDLNSDCTLRAALSSGCIAAEMCDFLRCPNRRKCDQSTITKAKLHCEVCTNKVFVYSLTQTPKKSVVHQCFDNDPEYYHHYSHFLCQSLSCNGGLTSDLPYAQIDSKRPFGITLLWLAKILILLIVVGAPIVLLCSMLASRQYNDTEDLRELTIRKRSWFNWWNWQTKNKMKGY